MIIILYFIISFRKHEKNKINQDIAEIYEEIESFQKTMKKDDSLLEIGTHILKYTSFPQTRK
jgi:GTPase involved in cell partitioning and DNA repair